MSIFHCPLKDLRQTVTEIENEISRVYSILNELEFNSRAWARFEAGRDADIKKLQERKFEYQIAIINLVEC